MLDLFHTEDGTLHQAALFYDGKKVVSVVVEKLISKDTNAVHWDWVVWAAGDSWQEPDIDWFGTEPSLEMAKFAALDAAIALADIVTKTTPSLTMYAPASHTTEYLPSTLH